MSEAARLDHAALDAHPLPPVIDGDKESKGRILIIAGSRDVPGAALLAATAAMRAGAGKLRIATVASAASQLAIAMPEAMVVGLPEAPDGGFSGASIDLLRDGIDEVDAVVSGPGVKGNDQCKPLAELLLAAPAALALDVSILRALDPAEMPKRNLPPLLLPNAHELAELLGCDAKTINDDPIDCGRRAAHVCNSMVLVKGVSSHVVTPRGDAWTYSGGAPGLGVSGSGDVLAGIVGGLLARGAEPLSALLWAVWLHGEAGAALARKVGPIGFLAREIPGEIPALLPR